MHAASSHGRSPRNARTDGIVTWSVGDFGGARVEAGQRCHSETSSDCQSGLSELVLLKVTEE